MNIAETIYQHVKIMPAERALEVLQFIAFLETKQNTLSLKSSKNDVLEFIENLPASKKRSDLEINHDFQSYRDEWE